MSPEKPIIDANLMKNGIFRGHNRRTNVAFGRPRRQLAEIGIKNARQEIKPATPINFLEVRGSGVPQPLGQIGVEFEHKSLHKRRHFSHSVKWI